jgi:hypothetical protein
MTTRSYNQRVITMIRILVITAIVATILASCNKRIAPDDFLFNSSRTIHFTIYQYKNEQIGQEMNIRNTAYFADYILNPEILPSYSDIVFY